MERNPDKETDKDAPIPTLIERGHRLIMVGGI